MNYIVLDMEWNQPFYGGKMIRDPFPLYGEIVEIGAVKLNESCHIIDTFKILVTPKYYTKMHKKVSKLTNIKNVDLQYGFPFDFALKQFKKWCGDEFVFLTWGPDDIGMLKSNIEIHNLSYDWLPKTYDVQMIFGYEIENTHRQISLSKAVEKLNIRGFEAHDALNDARTTAFICHYLNIHKDIENYEEIKAIFRKNAIELGGVLNVKK